jgi:hypothetical protein
MGWKACTCILVEGCCLCVPIKDTVRINRVPAVYSNLFTVVNPNMVTLYIVVKRNNRP